MILLISVYCLFIVLEVIKDKSLGFLFDFRNKAMLSLWLSICLFVYCLFYQKVVDVNPLCILVILLLNMASVFFLLFYLLFRGVFVLFSLSKEGLTHPTVATIKKFTANRLYALFFIAFIVLITHVSQIYCLCLCCFEIK